MSSASPHARLRTSRPSAGAAQQPSPRCPSFTSVEWPLAGTGSARTRAGARTCRALHRSAVRRAQNRRGVGWGGGTVALQTHALISLIARQTQTALTMSRPEPRKHGTRHTHPQPCTALCTVLTPTPHVRYLFLFACDDSQVQPRLGLYLALQLRVNQRQPFQQTLRGSPQQPRRRW